MAEASPEAHAPRGRGASGGYSRGGRGGYGASRGGAPRGGPRGGYGGSQRGGGYAPKRPANYQDYGGDYGEESFGMSKKRRIIDDVYRVLVPSRLVKVIIGKGGENIKAIKESVGNDCKISIYAQGTNNIPLPGGALDRVMSIQAPIESLEKALAEIIPKLQPENGKGKAEIRLIVPAHSCSAVIGPKGSNVKQIKEETKSFIMVHTVPLPNSDEHVVKLQNFEIDMLVKSAVSVFKSIADTKGKQHVTFYDPQVWTSGEYGDTGSYVDSEGSYGGYGKSYNGGGGYNSYDQYGGGGGGGGGGGNYDQSGYDQSGYDQSTYGAEPEYYSTAPAPTRPPLIRGAPRGAVRGGGSRGSRGGGGGRGGRGAASYSAPPARSAPLLDSQALYEPADY